MYLKQILAFLQRYCLTQEGESFTYYDPASSDLFSSTGGGLLTGAPSSPDLFNVYAGALIDDPLMSLCRHYHLTATRYLDDIVISSDKPIVGNVRKEIRQLVLDAGFNLSHHKCKVFDLAKGPVLINGVGLELGGRMFVPRWYLKKIVGLIHLRLKQRESDPTIHGMMSQLFTILGASPKRKLTKLERKVIEDYRWYHSQVKKYAWPSYKSVKTKKW